MARIIPKPLAASGGLISHASTHISGGSDQIDGDKLDIDYTPSNFTPVTVSTIATSTSHLTAFLAGIDNALISSGSTDKLVGISASDTTPGYLSSKLIANTGTPLTFSVVNSGSDEDLRLDLDGDKVTIDFSPSNYTPDSTIAEASSATDLSAFLAGIDNKFGGLTASDVGADPSGTAASAVSTHESDPDPHTQYHTDARALTWIGTRSTSDLSEGTNLYYTNVRADARIAAASVTDLSDVSSAGSGQIITSTERTNFGTAYSHSQLTSGNPHSVTASDVGADPSGTAASAVSTHESDPDPHTQYHTDARALTWIGTRSTSDLSEGTNLYYTNTRADARIAAASVTDLSDVSSAGSGQIITLAERTNFGTAYSHSQLTSGNPHSVTASDVGADPSGTAASAVSTHESDSDPHNEYLNVLHITFGGTPAPISASDTIEETWVAPFDVTLSSVRVVPISSAPTDVTLQLEKNPGLTPVDLLASSSEDVSGGTVDTASSVSIASGTDIELSQGDVVRLTLTCGASATGDALLIDSLWVRR